MSEQEKLVQFRVSGEALKIIEQLAKKRGARTMSEVFRNALRSYAALEDLRDEAGALRVTDKDGKRVRVILP